MAMASSPISEMNKPEAERCIEIALAAQQAGDIAKAERFLAKSISMFPTTKAQQLLVQVRTQSTSTSSASASAASPGSDASSTFTFQQQTSTSTSTTYQRKRSRSTSPARAAAPTYTAEQREAARAVIRLTNLYHILQLPLPTSATPPVDADIKAAYRKQALKFHPDKNRAPEAEEAFKKVSAAFQCLSDDRKRAAYDASGYQEGRPGLGMGGGGGGGGSGGGGGYYTREEDISPEDIFNMFFGGMSAGGGIYNMNGRRVFTRRRQYPPQGQQQQPQNGTGQTGGPAGLMQLVHFLPLLLLFLFSFLSSPASDESLPFSLTRTNTFPTQHSTPANLIYFTQPSFDYRYGRDRRMLRQVEDQVEQAYVKKWREGCSREEAELKRMRKEMEKRSGKEQLDVMEKIEQFEAKGMKNCASLADLKAHG